MSLGTMIIKCRTSEVKRGGGHLSLGTMIIKCRTAREREGGHLSLGTMIIKCRTSEREGKGGGALVSRNNDY